MTIRAQLFMVLALVLAALPAILAAAPAGPVEPAAAVPGGPSAEGAPPPAGERRASGTMARPPTVLELLQMGGPVMYPLYLSSILMVAFAIERGLSLRHKKILPPDFILNLRVLVGERPIDREKLLTYCVAHPSPIARIFQAAVRRLHRPLPEIEKIIEDAGAKEVRLLRRNCRVISSVAYIAPLLGLLGTVTGMIQCFTRVATGEALGRAERLAEGIYQALVTTAVGLTIAIPAAVIYLLYVAKVEKLVTEMDDLTLEFVETIADKRD
jgi:biopolymer transport protein ExbB